MAERLDSAITRRDWEHIDVPLITLPPGPFREDDIQVTIEGDHRGLRRMSWKHYSVFRFSWQRLRVEVLQRHGDGNVANLTVMSDLEPYFEGSRRYIESWRGSGQPG